jgi:hypothetical protein
MATRSSTNTPRSKKTSGATEQQSTSGAATITDANLERREIPSFSDSREARIAEAAYWRAERRGFAPGHELDDWLQAEKEVDGDEEERRPSR